MSGGGANIWALVPVKRFDRAKSRLAPFLSSKERGALAWAMFADVIETIGKAGEFAGTAVVTGDPAAALFARSAGAHAIGDGNEAGINEAVAHGIATLCAAERPSAVLVIAGDLPFLTEDELSHVVSALERGVVVVPAARDGGTNMLGLSPPSLMPPAFGADSCRAHCRMAARRGIVPAIVRLAGAGRDVDLIEDLAGPAAPATGRRTAALAESLGLWAKPATAHALRRALS